MAGNESLVFEWLAGCLAREFGLPIPNFSIVYVPEYLVDSSLGDYSDLGAGYAFGSLSLSSLVEITREYARKVPLNMQLDVLAFDWWVKNEDRKMGQIYGNPNLFINAKDGQLVVLDHNCAFDATFSYNSFRDEHVFSPNLPKLEDLVLRAKFCERFDKILDGWGGFCGSLPDDWLYPCGDPVEKQANYIDVAYEIVSSYKSDEFWVMP